MNFVENKFKEVARLINHNSTILDVGCNDGGIRGFLNDMDEYYGVDIDKSKISALAKQGVKVERVDLNNDELPFKNQRFDYILFLDVLEHILDPRQILVNAKKRLNEHGKILITLPNDYHILNKVRFIFNRHISSDPFAPYGHLHYFPIKTGEDVLIKGQGFEILNKVFIPPYKPSFLPQPIKNFLAKTFPQSFARDVLYLIQPIKWNTN